MKTSGIVFYGNAEVDERRGVGHLENAVSVIVACIPLRISPPYPGGREADEVVGDVWKTDHPFRFAPSPP